MRFPLLKLRLVISAHMQQSGNFVGWWFDARYELTWVFQVSVFGEAQIKIVEENSGTSELNQAQFREFDVAEIWVLTVVLNNWDENVENLDRFGLTWRSSYVICGFRKSLKMFLWIKVKKFRKILAVHVTNLVVKTLENRKTYRWKCRYNQTKIQQKYRYWFGSWGADLCVPKA
jgi:hypothetical protein